MKAFINKLCIKGMIAKENLKKMISEERGEANIIAIIMILVIVIGLVVIFRGAISDLVGDIIDRFTQDAKDFT